jgi:hypothetical protein
MTAVLLNGLVGVPVAFALLAWVMGRRPGAALGTAVTGGVVTFGWSVWLAVAAEP